MAGNSDNFIDNGDFKNIDFGGKPEVFLGTPGASLGGWTLFGSGHSVRFMSHGNSNVLGNLPAELQGSDVNFVCLNGNGLSGLIGRQTNESLSEGQTVEVTWFAALDNNHACAAPSYTHTVQLAEKVEHSGSDVPVAGELFVNLSVTRSDGWRKFRETFTVKGSGLRYLSFKGDKNGGACGVVISGVKVVVVGGGDDVVKVAGDGEVSAKPKFPVTRIDFTVTRNDQPLKNTLVEIRIDGADTTGTQFVGGESSYTVHTGADGKAFIPANEIIAGTAGRVKLVAEVSGHTLALTIIVIKNEGDVTPISGAAYSLKKVDSTYASGDDQNAPTKTRFSRMLTVSVWDRDNRPATSGEVTFTVTSSSADTKGFLASNDGDTFDTVSTAGKTSLGAPVNQGFAKIWLWGQYGLSSGSGQLVVKANGKDLHGSEVGFSEQVWPSADSLTLTKTQGDEQSVLTGQAPTALTVRLASGANAVRGEWLHWTSDTSALTFTHSADTDSFVWSDAKSIWVRTDASGVASVSGIEAISSSATADAKVTVTSSVAASVVFTLHLNPAASTSKYEIVWEDLEALPVDTEVSRTVLVRDRVTQARLGGVSVLAEIDSKNDSAKIVLTPSTQTTKSTPDADLGRATFQLMASKEGASHLKLSVQADKNSVADVTLVANRNAVRKHLIFSTPDHLTISPASGGTSEINPIRIFLQPADADITQIEYEVKPTGDHALLRVQEGSGAKKTHGSLTAANGQFVVPALAVSDSIVNSSDEKKYTITFSVKGHPTIDPITCYVDFADGVYVHRFPEQITRTDPYPLDAGSRVENDSKLYVVTSQDKDGDIVVPHVKLRFHITVTAPVGADQRNVVFVNSQSDVEEASTDDSGKCFLPAMEIKNWSGSFEVAIYNGVGASAVDRWYFQVTPPRPPALIIFNRNRSTLEVSHPYELSDPVDTVTVYADLQKTSTVRGGTVNFSIRPDGATKASFKGPNGKYVDGEGKPILLMSSRISSNGKAPVPPLRAPHAGTLTLDATVSNIAPAVGAYKVGED